VLSANETMTDNERTVRRTVRSAQWCGDVVVLRDGPDASPVVSPRWSIGIAPFAGRHHVKTT